MNSLKRQLLVQSSPTSFEAGLLKINYGYSEVEIVIPDRLMEKAVEALGVDDLRCCDDPDCTELRVDRTYRWKENSCSSGVNDRIYPVGSAHFHIKTYSFPD
ncbi:hypothetical protein BDV06DRAFT_222541 [Aspergillus oleicola]